MFDRSPGRSPGHHAAEQSSSPRQRAIDFVVRDDARGQSYNRCRIMPLDWSQCAALESVPGKVSGSWVFRGTRIPVAAVFANLEDGFNIDQIVEMFEGLTRDQVKSVLEFAAHTLEASPAG